MGEELTWGNELRVDGEYFVQLLNGDEISEVGGDIRRESIGENERVVMREEIMDVIEKMKGGKAAGMDGIVIGMLKNRGTSISDWLLRIFNKCIKRVGRQHVLSQYTKGKVTGEIVLIIEE